MNIMYYCIYIYLLLKPFYIFKSGSIQPSDIFLILAFGLFLVSKNKKKINKIISHNYKFLFFVICTLVINVLYFFLYVKYTFLISSLYYIFNFIAIILFTVVFENEKVTKNISLIFKINIVIQLLIYLFGLGRYFGLSRYMGTFNDPNQFGYFIVMSYMFVYLISLKYNNNKGIYVLLIISLFLIIECASTGMFMCALVFILLQIVDIIRKFGEFLKKNKNKIIIGTFLLIPIISLLHTINMEYKFIDFDNLFIISRINEKIDKSQSSDVSLIQERGYDRFIYYPQYVLYGSGEGENTRFTMTYHQLEIHATLPSILFYYGIIPTLILLSWIYDKIKKIEIKVFIPLLALFIESFTLANQRQALFWVIILFSSYFTKNKMLAKNGDFD